MLVSGVSGGLAALVGFSGLGVSGLFSSSGAGESELVRGSGCGFAWGLASGGFGEGVLARAGSGAVCVRLGAADLLFGGSLAGAGWFGVSGAGFSAA